MEKVFSVEKIGNLSIDMLMSPEMKAEIDYAVSTIQKSQEALYSLANDDNTKLTGIKAGTVLIVSIINKVSKGKEINEFTEDDWKEISESVIDNAVLMDEMKYSKMVFLTYADYIDASALSISRFASEDRVVAIKTLSSEIRAKSEAFDRGEIAETAFIEDCMWIALEAMVKLLASTLALCSSKDFGKLSYAVSVFAFEYGRMTLYKQENEILTEYIENQRMLSDELEEKYKQYLESVEKQTKIFSELVEDAFSTDCRTRLRKSAEIAKAAGVEESEILKTKEEIDDFFM